MQVDGAELVSATAAECMSVFFKGVKARSVPSCGGNGRCGYYDVVPFVWEACAQCLNAQARNQD